MQAVDIADEGEFGGFPLRRAAVGADALAAVAGGHVRREELHVAAVGPIQQLPLGLGRRAVPAVDAGDRAVAEGHGIALARLRHVEPLAQSRDGARGVLQVRLHHRGADAGQRLRALRRRERQILRGRRLRPGQAHGDRGDLRPWIAQAQRGDCHLHLVGLLRREADIDLRLARQRDRLVQSSQGGVGVDPAERRPEIEVGRHQRLQPAEVAQRAGEIAEVGGTAPVLRDAVHEGRNRTIGVGLDEETVVLHRDGHIPRILCQETLVGTGTRLARARLVLEHLEPQVPRLLAERRLLAAQHGGRFEPLAAVEPETGGFLEAQGLHQRRRGEPEDAVGHVGRLEVPVSLLVDWQHLVNLLLQEIETANGFENLGHQRRIESRKAQTLTQAPFGGGKVTRFDRRLRQGGVGRHAAGGGCIGIGQDRLRMGAGVPATPERVEGALQALAQPDLLADRQAALGEQLFGDRHRPRLLVRAALANERVQQVGRRLSAEGGRRLRIVDQRQRPGRDGVEVARLDRVGHDIDQVLSHGRALGGIQRQPKQFVQQRLRLRRLFQAPSQPLRRFPAERPAQGDRCTGVLNDLAGQRDGVERPTGRGERLDRLALERGNLLRALFGYRQPRQDRLEGRRVLLLAHLHGVLESEPRLHLAGQRGTQGQ